jgi:hypothetical protein
MVHTALRETGKWHMFAENYYVIEEENDHWRY